MGIIRDFFGKLFGEQRRPASGSPPARPPHRVEAQQRQPRKQPAAQVSQHRREELYQPGDIIADEYQIHSKLGEGGFGVVFLAYNINSREVFALKTFRDEFLANGAARDAFKREALLWIGLGEHPYILTAGWVNDFSGRLFVAMDYIAPDEKGRVSLQDHLLDCENAFPLEQTLRWGVQLCYAMEHAAAHGIKCHRDIKPSNVLVTQGGTPMIGDFGLATAAEVAWKGKRPPVSATGTERLCCSLLVSEGRNICGTPGYIAPELYENRGGDVRSDIYSFGIVLWQMATGSPVSAFHAAEVLNRGNGDAYAQEYQKRVYERQRAGHFPTVKGPLREVIERCLAYERSERYRDFGELRERLDELHRRAAGRSVPISKLPEMTAVLWNNKGVSLDILGRYEEAIRCYDQSLQLDARHARASMNKGISLDHLERHEEALRCFDRALQVDPRLPRAWGAKGECLALLGRYEEAIRCYDQGIQIDPRLLAAWKGKGNSLNNLGRREEAISCYDRALQIDPHYRTAWYSKGCIFDALGRHDEAIRCYDQALKIDPRFVEAWHNKASALADMSRHEEAIRCYDQALEIDPRLVQAWYWRAVSLAELGNYSDALLCYDEALQVDPKLAQAWYDKGCIFYELHQREEALRCYDRALQIDPGMKQVWINQGITFAELGQFEDAIRCYDQAIQIDPRDATQWYNKGNVYDELGDREKALRCYDQALQIDSGFKQVWMAQGLTFADVGQHKHAIHCYDQVIKIDARDRNAWAAKAASEGALGRRHEAAQCMRKVIELSPQMNEEEIAQAREFVRGLERE